MIVIDWNSFQLQTLLSLLAGFGMITGAAIIIQTNKQKKSFRFS